MSAVQAKPVSTHRTDNVTGAWKTATHKGRRHSRESQGLGMHAACVMLAANIPSMHTCGAPETCVSPAEHLAGVPTSTLVRALPVTFAEFTVTRVGVHWAASGTNDIPAQIR